MADDRWRVVRLIRGKSEHHTAACLVKNAGVAFVRLRRRKVSQKRYRRFFEKSAGKGEKARKKLTAREVIRAAGKTPCGARQNRRRTAGPSISGYRRTTLAVAVVYDHRNNIGRSEKSGRDK